MSGDTEGAVMAENEGKKALTRREFVVGMGGAGVGAVLGGIFVHGILLPDEIVALPASEGYLLVDTKKCAACQTCMLSCSLAHEGETSLSLSRIQVVSDPFAGYPEGPQQNQCRQCPYPACVEACPTGANHVDAANGNVRTIDASKCIGCERCIQACPFTPSRVEWNFEEKHSQKCDLCATTPYWDQKGGPGGKQACVELCPLKAIAFTNEIPIQGDKGYFVNLRKGDATWLAFGFPDGDNGEYLRAPAAQAGEGTQ